MVYPCVYREHEVVLSSQQCLAGLSLCIQGTLFQCIHRCTSMRFIPVYTGNTTQNLIKIFLLAVYPCVYREHSNATTTRWNKIGLSLCIQGTRYVLQLAVKKRTVYPCVYREHSNCLINSTYFAGLSLCIQGTRNVLPCGDHLNRFIPVYTGNTLIRSILC